jgi:hypothetical protein
LRPIELRQLVKVVYDFNSYMDIRSNPADSCPVLDDRSLDPLLLLLLFEVSKIAISASFSVSVPEGFFLLTDGNI